MREVSCPLCSRKLYVNSWHESGFGTVETIEECREGCKQYLNHWAYGNQLLRVGKWEVGFTCHSYINQEQEAQVEKYFNEFNRRIPRLRKYFKRTGRFRKESDTP